MKKFLATLFAAALFMTAGATAASAEEVTTSGTCGCVFEDETAWVLGDDYAGNNWAMFYEFTGDEQVSVPLVAGRDHVQVGIITFYPGATTMTIGIQLFGGPRFASDSESVKVQYYDYDPSGISNPAPGKFKYKGAANGNTYAWVYNLPYNPLGSNFYGIHSDVLVPVGYVP